MAIITEEMQERAKRAFENRKDSYHCFATGNTFAVKEDLKSFAFQWDGDSRSWTLECCSEWDKFLFERKVADGIWPGVVLEFAKAEQVVTQEMVDEFERGLKEKTHERKLG